MRVLRSGLLRHLVAPFYLPLGLCFPVLNTANTDAKVMRLAMSHMMDNQSCRVLRTIVRWIEGRKLGDHVDYHAGMSSIRTPVLIVAGEGDHFHPPSEARELLGLLGDGVRQLEILGWSSGLSDDYSHAELLFGRDVEADSFSLVARWLEERFEDTREGECAGLKVPTTSSAAQDCFESRS